MQQDEEIDYTKDAVLRKFPMLGITLSHLNLIPDNSVSRAETDGEAIYYSPNFMKSLSDGERVFVLAHEAMHVAFNHILRSKDKDLDTWNIATDAVINQILKGEGLPLAKDGIDMADAVNRSAEEMYEKLLQETPKNDDKNKDDKSGNCNNHKMWRKTVERAEKEQAESQRPKGIINKIKELILQKLKGIINKIKELRSQKSNDKAKPAPENQKNPEKKEENGENEANKEQDNFEKYFVENNRQERHKQAQAIMAKLQNRKNESMQKQMAITRYFSGAVDEAAAVLDWEKILKPSLPVEYDGWSYRRSCAENNWMARVEDMENEVKSKVEVMLDISGSVDNRLLKGFLRQLKPILKTSKLKVGYFDNKVHAFQEIKNEKDIDNFKIIGDEGGTDWDLAVKAFSKDKNVNKIIFTDGEIADYNTMPTEETRDINVIWLVYGNEDFHPVCGRVIRVDEHKIRQNFITKACLLHDGRNY